MQPRGCILGPAWQYLILQMVPDYSWVPLFLTVDSKGKGMLGFFFPSVYPYVSHGKASMLVKLDRFFSFPFSESVEVLHSLQLKKKKKSQKSLE